MKRLLFIVFFLVVTKYDVMAQGYPVRYFRMPMDITPSLSATFGEVRANHYHSGLDIRTDGAIGHPVYAVADGYVSRINISAWGGGKIVYIDHPNGYRSVYMHLNDFCGEIGQWVRDYQYRHQCYAFDTNVAPGRIKVYKGQIIAHSGNTGSSGGPHLHFELRYANNDQTINAQLFGLYVPDNVAPTIKGIRIYPATAETMINGSNAPLEVLQPAVRAKKGRRGRPATTLSPTVSGDFYLGIYATDHSESYNGNNGVYRIELRIDEQLVYRYTAETFRFEDSRAVNGMVDYPLYIATHHPYILTRVLPYSPPTMSRPERGDGVFYLKGGAMHTVRYDVYDANGNHTGKSFTINTPATQKASTYRPERRGQRKEQMLRGGGYQVVVPAEALYTADSVVCRMEDGCLSVVPSSEGDSPMPPHVPYTLRMPLAGGASCSDVRQMLIVRKSGKKWVAETTRFADGWVEAKPRNFGVFTLAVDSVAPTIRPPKSLVARHEHYLTFKIADNLSGIDSYRCMLNGRWILAEYDGKSSSLIVQLPRADAPASEPQLLNGGNVLSVSVSDACGNTTIREFRL